MQISSQTIFPLNLYGRIQIRGRNGKFRAITVSRSFFDADPQQVSFMLRNSNGTSEYSSNADMYEDKIVVVEPINGPLMVDVMGPNNMPMVSYGLTDTFKSWWSNPTYKYTIIVAAIVLVLLIIWLIWSMMRKRNNMPSSLRGRSVTYL